MKKLLDFTVKRKRFEKKAGRMPHGRPVMHLAVDTIGLTPTARALAERIHTLENADDLSNVSIASNITRAETIHRDWDKPARIRQFSHNGCKTPTELIKKWEKVYGRDYLNEHIQIVWRWDALGNNETPEEYFERHASRIDASGYIVT